MALPIFPPLVLKTNLLIADVDPGQKILWLGLLLTLYPLGQFFGAPFLGKLSDHYGRKRVILVSLLLNSLCYFGCGFGIHIGSFFILSLSRILLGLSSGSLAIAQAAFSDISKTFFKPKSYSIIYATISLSFILGPLFGGFISKVSYTLPFYLIGYAILFIALSALFTIKESIASKSDKKISQFEIFSAIKTIIQERSLRPFFLKHLLIYLGIFSYFRFYVIYFTQTFHFSPMTLGSIISFCAVCSALFQLFLAPQILKRVSDLKATGSAAIVFAGSIFSLSMISDPHLLPLAVIPIASMIGLLLPFLALIISNLAKTNRMGSAMGANHSMQMLAEITSGLCGMWIAATSAIYPILIGGVFASLGSLLFFRTMQEKFAKEI